MITKQQEKLLENQIYRMLKESMFENSFIENVFPEKKSEKKHDKKDDDEDTDEDSNKRILIMKWLDSAQQLHSTVAYDLWPDMDRDSARSEFSKKYRGQDDDGKPYEFSAEEINRIYNIRSKYIKKARLKEKI